MAKEDTAVQHDIETLRLIYAELSEEERRLREFGKESSARFLALPLSAGLIIGLLLAVRPEDGDVLLTILLALGAIPFLMILAFFVLTGIISFRRFFQEIEQDGEYEQRLQARIKQMDMPEEMWLRARIEEMGTDEKRNLGMMRKGSRFMGVTYSLALALLGLEVIWLLGVSLIWPYID